MMEIRDIDPEELLFLNRMLEASAEERRNAAERLQEWGKGNHLSSRDRQVLQRCLAIIAELERADMK